MGIIVSRLVFSSLVNPSYMHRTATASPICIEIVHHPPILIIGLFCKFPARPPRRKARKSPQHCSVHSADHGSRDIKLRMVWNIGLRVQRINVHRCRHVASQPTLLSLVSNLFAYRPALMSVRVAEHGRSWLLIMQLRPPKLCSKTRQFLNP